MQPATLYRTPVRRGLTALAFAAATTVIACGNDVNFQPTAPTFSDFTRNTSARRLEAG